MLITSSRFLTRFQFTSTTNQNSSNHDLKVCKACTCSLLTVSIHTSGKLVTEPQSMRGIDVLSERCPLIRDLNSDIPSTFDVCPQSFTSERSHQEEAVSHPLYHIIITSIEIIIITAIAITIITAIVHHNHNPIWIAVITAVVIVIMISITMVK